MKKFKTLIFMFLLPAIVAIITGAFSLSSISRTAYALSGNGGAFYVGNNSTYVLEGRKSVSRFKATNGGGVYIANGGTFKMTGGDVFANSASNGGGVYVAGGGTFTMSGGSISQNTATSSANGVTYGGGVFTAGTFNMSGGSIVENKNNGIYVSSGVTTISGGTIAGNSTNAIYVANNGKLVIAGGTIVGDIKAQAGDIHLSKEAEISGKIILADSTKSIILDNWTPYFVPTYTLDFSELVTVDTSKAYFVFAGTTGTQADTSKMTIVAPNGYITVSKMVNGTNGIYFEKEKVEFPRDWKTQVASTTYMTTTVTPENLTSIKFVSSVPSGYTKIGTLSTGLSVYKGTTATDIAFVGRKIMAPANSSNLFYNCTSLTSLDLSNFNTSKVTTMYFMFGGCTSLTSLNIKSFDTSKVTSMFGMFSSCSKLTSIDVSGFNTANVTDMSGMFSSCSSLTSLNLESFGISKVTSMSGMFSGCSSLTSLDLSNFDTSKVTAMFSMFSGCSKLMSLDLSGFNTANVTDMSLMFEYCFELTSLDLSGFNTANVTDMSSMFKHCSSLESLNISSFNMTKVTSSSYMLYFSSTNKIKTFKTPYNNSVEIPITTGIKLYRMSNSVEISSVPANTAYSFEIVGCESHSLSITDTSYKPIDSMNHSMTITRTCSNCGCTTITTKTMKHNLISGVCKMCGYGGFIEYVINKNQDRRNIDIIFEKDKQRKEFFVLKVAG